MRIEHPGTGTASTAGGANKTTDPSGTAYTASDGDGYLLFGHDITAGDGATAVVTYINFDSAIWCYTINANGTVHQWDTAGVEQS